MSKALMNDVLIQSVGEPVVSKNGEIIGKIIEVTRNSKNHYIDYLILKCEQYENESTHFFAIPASTRFINISDTFTIFFNTQRKTSTLLKRYKQTGARHPI